MRSTVYLETFGCQMNVADSERADVRLRAAGFDLCPSPETADVVIFNTCSVRERAAHKVLTRIGEVRRQRHALPGTWPLFQLLWGATSSAATVSSHFHAAGRRAGSRLTS